MAKKLDYEASVVEDADGGVYYREEDMPGFWVRLAVSLVDAVVLVVLMVLVLGGWHFVLPDLSEGGIVLGIVLIWGYTSVLKAYGPGTVGYQLFGLRLVTLKGQPAALWKTTLRAFAGFWLNPLMDLLWMSTDGRRQAVRDKLTGTYVVRARAKAAGRGKIVYVRLHLAGIHLVCAEVVRNAHAEGAAA